MEAELAKKEIQFKVPLPKGAGLGKHQFGLCTSFRPQKNRTSSINWPRSQRHRVKRSTTGQMVPKGDSSDIANRFTRSVPLIAIN